MRAEISGRKLGIGLRLAARAAWQRAGQSGAASAPDIAQAPTAAPFAKAATQAASGARLKGKAFVAGTRRFGEAVVGPVAHTSSVLWLEITGLFFALFAFFFGQSVYRLRGEWQRGPEHAQFLIYSALTLAFLWFALFNFFRARQKEKKNRARRAETSRN